MGNVFSITSKIELVLRIGIFGTFLGHGLLAISVNPSWLPYLATVGISPEQAKILMVPSYSDMKTVKAVQENATVI